MSSMWTVAVSEKTYYDLEKLKALLFLKKGAKFKGTKGLVGYLVEKELKELEKNKKSGS